MGRPHALLVPFPGQGHVKALVEFARRLAEEGFLVTFVNTEFVDAHMMAALPESSSNEHGTKIRFVAVPDGMDPEQDHIDLRKFSDFVHTEMPGILEELMLKINEEEEEKITCMIADGTVATLLSVAEKLNIKKAVFWPASAWLLAIIMMIPKLVSSGVIDENGFPGNEAAPIELSAAIPALDPAHLCWIAMTGGPSIQEMFFHYLRKCSETMNRIDHIACNSFSELETAAFEVISSALPVGHVVCCKQDQPSSFWREDLSCLDWLGQHPDGSVIYVSLGSTTLLDQQQLEELALGLELTGRPFLWASRPGLMNQAVAAYPEGFMDRVAGRGLIVSWARQQEVLSHPSTACFLTHCGWNSAVEGVINGVPMLCWPYIADHFQNETYIVEVWKVALGLVRGEDGIVRKEEIKSKLEALLNDHEIKERVLELKDKCEKSVMMGGTSFKGFHDLVNAMKAGQV